MSTDEVTAAVRGDLFGPDMADLVSIPNLDGFADPADVELLGDVFARLAAYAGHKASAMRHRAGGDIEAALSFERAADAQYKRLPEWARW